MAKWKETVAAVNTISTSFGQFARSDVGRSISAVSGGVSLVAGFVALPAPVHPTVKLIAAITATGAGVISTGLDCAAELVSVGCIGGAIGTTIGMPGVMGGRAAALLSRQDVGAFLWNAEAVQFVFGLG